MRGLVILAVLIASVICQDSTTLNPSNCGQRLSQLGGVFDPSKVVGGTEAVKGDWNWQVVMNYNGRFICGGSLINSQWIITAAHCVEGALNPTFYSFDLGVHDRVAPESWAVNRKVTKVFMHEQYNGNTMKNDIALLKLDSPVAYSKYIAPVCIPDGTIGYGGSTSWATGWGTLRYGGAVSRYLMQVDMPLLTDQRCKQKFNSVDTNSVVCAGETGQNKDTCQGDSGGPLVVQHASDKTWNLIGLTSWGYGCGDGGVYTRVSTYKAWILNKITAN